MKKNMRPVKTKIHKLYFLYRLIHHGCRETKQFMSSCVCLCDCCDSLKDACHRHVSHRAQTFDSAHEDTRPGHATTHRSTKQVICASTLATSFLAYAWCCLSTQLSFLYLSLLDLFQHSLQNHSALSAHQLYSHFLFPIPSFFFSSYSQWMRKNKMKIKGEGGVS